MNGFPVEFASPIGLAAWSALVFVPVAIIALYFLKLRRKPVQVPSTLLWRRSLEDLHVNSLFQRLRRNLLLFLQLLAVLLVMLALAGPRFKGSTGQGRRLVLTIDHSASMSAADVKPTRLAKAKEEAKKVVDGLESNDLAMVISFSDRARVVSNYTANRSLLKQRIDAIEPTEATTSLREALQVAAGLANPSKQVEGVAATSIVPPTMLIYTDGGFPDVDGFSLGNLQPELIILGQPPKLAEAAEKEKPKDERRPSRSPSNNVAIVALQTRRSEEKTDQYQVFGRVHNFKDEAVTVDAQLIRHDAKTPGDAGQLKDAIQLKINAQGEQSFNFDLPDEGATELEVKLVVEDDLPLDNRAFTLIGDPRKAQILVVTDGNKYLVDTLRTAQASQRAEVIVTNPTDVKGDAFQNDLRAGRYDLAVFDRYTPPASPECNTLYFGALPPGEAYAKTTVVENPTILDVNSSHPLMQYIRDLSVVRVAKAITVELPGGGTPLIESNVGPLAFAVPRSGFTDAVVTFELPNPPKSYNTDWVTKYSFPLFLFNTLQVLGNARESAGEEIHIPGQPVVLRGDASASPMTITDPKGNALPPLARTPQGQYIFNDANRTGLYHARIGNNPDQPPHVFAVNQFDLRESDLAPRGLPPEGVVGEAADAYKIKIGYNPVNASAKPSRITPLDRWWYLALLALGVVLFEWYIYNRRVYI